jgi:hypothetical protein
MAGLGSHCGLEVSVGPASTPTGGKRHLALSQLLCHHNYACSSTQLRSDRGTQLFRVALLTGQQRLDTLSLTFTTGSLTIVIVIRAR